MMDTVERCDTSDDMAKSSDGPLSTMIGVRVTQEERDAWAAAAKKDGRTLSSWVIARCRGIQATPPELDDDKPKRRTR